MSWCQVSSNYHSKSNSVLWIMLHIKLCSREIRRFSTNYLFVIIGLIFSLIQYFILFQESTLFSQLEPLSPCTVINPILLTYLLSIRSTRCYDIERGRMYFDFVWRIIICALIGTSTRNNKKMVTYLIRVLLLKHCGLVLPYGDIDLGQYWPR